MMEDDNTCEFHTADPPQTGSRMVCVVPGCKQRSGFGISFHVFPDRKEKKRFQDWVRALRLKIEPADSARVCSIHFSINNFINPSVNRITDRMLLRRSAVPDVNLPQPVRDPRVEKLAVDRAERAKRRENQSAEFNALDTSGTQETATIDSAMDTSQNDVPATADAAVQVDTLDIDKLFIGRRRSMAIRFKSDAELNAWTGLHSFRLLDTIKSAIESLAEYKEKKHCNIPLDEQILVVFIKLKTNLSFSCMAALFQVHYQTVSGTFYRTLPWVKAVCEPLIFWPTQTQIKSNMPLYFRGLYEDVVAVLDCTEIAINKPKCLHCRINSYSHYKGKETAKYLVVVTPGGTISYISGGYGGKVSDKQVVVQEKVLDKINVGEAVMTDKGFLIDEECRSRGIKLVRPPFLHTPQTQLSSVDAAENVSIAAARVHVERAIQRFKLFGIFSDKIDSFLLPVLDDIVFICCAIANVSRPILSNERF